MTEARATILVVDDDAGIQELLADAFEEEGYQVVLAGDGLAALDQLSMLRPDLIVLDLMMPRMDGYTFAQERRRRGLHQDVPLLVLTADAAAEQKAAQLGAQAALEKPFSLMTLLNRVEGLLTQHPRGSDGSVLSGPGS